jgi:translation initiation factor 2 alpha subunit (eIF-2alpha)
MTDNGARDQEIYRRVKVYGWTQGRTAQHFGLSQPRVSEIISMMETRGLPDAAALRQASYERLMEIQARQLEISLLKGAPVTAGKDGDVVYDPETNEVVRDYGAILKALADAVRTDSELAKRFGLDAATKVEAKQTVRYEIAGLDSDDLT